MSKHFLAALLACATLSLSAHADHTFQFSDVPFYSSPSGGTAVGVLNGFINTNDDYSAFTSYNLYTSSLYAPGGGNYGLHYIPRYASITASTSQYLRLDSLDNHYELQLYFVNGLSASGGTLLTASSYENGATGGTRYATGSAVPVFSAAAVTPEPSSLVLLGTGVLGIVAAVKRRIS